MQQTCPAKQVQEAKEPFHLPLSLGLLDESGQDIALEENRQTGSRQTVVLNITQEKESFTFEKIEHKPIPSLLRGFSAPVKLEYDYTRDELMFLMSHDSDGFNRWEAGQRLAVDVIQEIVRQIQTGAEIVVDDRLVKACENNLNQAIEHDRDGSIDKAMIATMLVMPQETYLAELAEVADVDAIHQAREAVRGEIATRLKGLLLSVYKLNQDAGRYGLNAKAIARRSLKNMALSYLMQPNDTEMVSLCISQFEKADNMTDTSAAIRALVNSGAETAQIGKEKALTGFFNRWSAEALVIDQWFSIQAACALPDTLQRVKTLMTHGAFDMKNPNRMRSLVATFAFQNNVNFHQRNGGGYVFLADRVIELNAINPQMAARILSPLTRWGKYDEQRQDLMKAELNRILETENLSENVFEVASKSV